MYTQWSEYAKRLCFKIILNYVKSTLDSPPVKYKRISLRFLFAPYYFAVKIVFDFFILPTSDVPRLTTVIISCVASIDNSFTKFHENQWHHC